VELRTTADGRASDRAEFNAGRTLAGPLACVRTNAYTGSATDRAQRGLGGRCTAFNKPAPSGARSGRWRARCAAYPASATAPATNRGCRARHGAARPPASRRGAGLLQPGQQGIGTDHKARRSDQCRPSRRARPRPVGARPPAYDWGAAVVRLPSARNFGGRVLGSAGRGPPQMSVSGSKSRSPGHTKRAPTDRYLSETVCVGSERLEDGPPQERAEVPLDNVTVGQREPDSVVRDGCDLADAKHFGISTTRIE
jgi:hypothetical protein